MRHSHNYGGRSRSCVSGEIFGAYGVVSALEIRPLARGLKVNVEQPSGRQMTGPLGLLAFPRRRVLYRLILEPSLQQVGRSVRASFGNKIATAIELLNAVIPDIHGINALITKSQ